MVQDNTFTCYISWINASIYTTTGCQIISWSCSLRGSICIMCAGALLPFWSYTHPNGNRLHKKSSKGSVRGTAQLMRYINDTLEMEMETKIIVYRWISWEHCFVSPFSFNFCFCLHLILMGICPASESLPVCLSVCLPCFTCLVSSVLLSLCCYTYHISTWCFFLQQLPDKQRPSVSSTIPQSYILYSHGFLTLWSVNP